MQSYLTLCALYHPFIILTAWTSPTQHLLNTFIVILCIKYVLPFTLDPQPQSYEAVEPLDMEEFLMSQLKSGDAALMQELGEFPDDDLKVEQLEKECRTVRHSVPTDGWVSAFHMAQWCCAMCLKAEYKLEWQKLCVYSLEYVLLHKYTYVVFIGQKINHHLFLYNCWE